MIIWFFVANKSFAIMWGDRRGLNPRQPEPQSGALPTELRPPYYNWNFMHAVYKNQPLINRSGFVLYNKFIYSVVLKRHNAVVGFNIYSLRS